MSSDETRADAITSLTTGDAAAGDALRAVVAAFERGLPGSVRGYYVVGSFADATAITTSDLDVDIVLKDAADAETLATARRLADGCVHDSARELDITITDEAELARGCHPNFKLSSALIAGEDIRDQVPLISLTDWTRDRMHSSWWRVARLFARPAIITLPLSYPEPAEPFLGYTQRTVRLSNGDTVASTRDLIRLIGWAATALLALQCGVYVSDKRDVRPLYRERIGGESAALVEDVFTLCRTRWAYLIPNDSEERAALRAICERTLGFEQSFVAVYREYLLAELHGDDMEGVRFAAEVLRRAPLRDDAVIAALEALTRRDSGAAGAEARKALALLSESVGD